MDFRYEPPMGDIVEIAECSQIVEDVLTRDESFWREGECFGVLEACSGQRNGDRLVMVYVPPFGFFLEASFPGAGESPLSFVPRFLATRSRAIRPIPHGHYCRTAKKNRS